METTTQKNPMGLAKQALVVASIVMIVPIFATMVLPMLLLVAPLGIVATPFMVVTLFGGVQAQGQREKHLRRRQTTTVHAGALANAHG